MRRRVAATAFAAVVLAGCTGADNSPGGLPGPVPDGVTFREPEASAPPAAEFDLTLLNGQVLDSASQWDERPLVMVFFESWCELCREQQSDINDLAEQYENVVLFVGVAGQSPQDDVTTYTEENDVPYPVGVDSSGDMWLNYAATEPPLVVLVTKGGYVARGWPGGLDRDDLKEQIDTFLVLP